MKPVPLALAAALALAVPPPAGAQSGGDYDLRSSTAAAGGVTFAAGGGYRLGGTLAAPAAGPVAAGDYRLAAGFWGPAGSPTVHAPRGDDLPTAFAARLGGPNPFRGTATLRFDLPAPGRVSIAVYGTDGRRVRDLVDDGFPAGRHAAHWDGTDRAGRAVAPGIYFARVEAGGARATLRLVRLH